jgi:hypothetical protein
VRQLAQEFAPALGLSDDYLGDVDKVAAAAASAGRADEYYKLLDLTSVSMALRVQTSGSNRGLVSLGFCGLITTNFDPTLEQACIAEYSGTAGVHRCEPVDLRDRPYLVYQFLRSLGASPRHERVLHLHGFHSLPRRLILGARDYAEAYRHDSSTPDAALRTLPRKIIRTLLATRPVLFVGFSMTGSVLQQGLGACEERFHPDRRAGAFFDHPVRCRPGRHCWRSALKNSGWVDAIAPGTELEIQVREPATCHRLTVQEIRRWCDGVAVSPDNTLKK